MSLSFNQFCLLYNLKNKSTSSDDIERVARRLNLLSFDIYNDDDKLKTRQGIINLDSVGDGTHWVCFHFSSPSASSAINSYFDSFGGPPSRNIEHQLKPFVYSTYQIQKLDESLCAAYCLYVLYMINIEKFHFEKAVLYLYYQHSQA